MCKSCEVLINTVDEVLIESLIATGREKVFSLLLQGVNAGGLNRTLPGVSEFDEVMNSLKTLIGFGACTKLIHTWTNEFYASSFCIMMKCESMDVPEAVTADESLETTKDVLRTLKAVSASCDSFEIVIH